MSRVSARDDNPRQSASAKHNRFLEKSLYQAHYHEPLACAWFVVCLRASYLTGCGVGYEDIDGNLDFADLGMVGLEDDVVIDGA